MGTSSANRLKLAATSCARTVRPLTGALSWNVASPIVTIDLESLSSGCSTFVARNSSVTPVSVGTYHMWSKIVKPSVRPCASAKMPGPNDIHARERRRLPHAQDAAGLSRPVLRAVVDGRRRRHH